MVGFLSRTISAMTALIAAVSALPEITQKGSKFFTPDGNQWFIKGVAYQLDPVDLGKDPAQCQRDAQLMKELGANMIRVYHVQVRSVSSSGQAVQSLTMYAGRCQPR